MLNSLMGMVPNASAHGVTVGHMLEVCHWFMLVLFVGWISFFFVAISRFRSGRNSRADYQGVTNHYSSHAEVAVVFVELILLVGFAFPLWGKRVLDFPPDQSDVLRVRAVAQQYLWSFHYPGPDSQFGSQDLGLVSSSNPLGLVSGSSEGKDDIVVTNELHVVVDKPVIVEITSKDVIHGFAVHHMRVSQDAIPGTRVPIWFRPIRTGKFEIACSQLCGGGHYSMRAFLIVESQQAFDEFYKEYSQMQHPATPSK